MRLTASQINENQILLSVSKLKETLTRCDSTLNRIKLKLFDLGFLSNPNVFDEKVIRRALVEEFDDNIDLLCSNLDGSLQLNSTRLMFAEFVSDDADFREIAHYLYLYYKNVENMKALKKTLDSNVVRSKAEVIELNPKISVAESIIKSRCQVEFDNPAVRSCIVPHEGYEIVSYDMKYLVYGTICTQMGVSEEDLVNARELDNGLFINGLTFKQEVNFVNELVKGDLVSTTALGDKLENDILEYYRSIRDDDTLTYGKITYDADIYAKSFKARMSLVGSIRNENPDLVPCFLTNDTVMFEKKKEHSTFTGYAWNIVGNYVLDWATQDELPKINTLLGYSGEFVAEKDCKKLGFKRIANAVPVIMKVLDSNGDLIEVPYFSISQLSDRDGNPIVAHVGNGITFDFMSMGDALNLLNCQNREVLPIVLYTKYTPAISLDGIGCTEVEFKKLVCDLTLALIEADCGVIEYESTLADKSFVTDDIFLNASFEAERLFNSLGF